MCERLVVSPPPMRALRPHRMCDSSPSQHASHHAASDRPELRARRGLVLGLQDRGVRGRARHGTAAIPSARSAGARRGRARAARLAGSPALTRCGGQSAGHARGPTLNRGERRPRPSPACPRCRAGRPLPTSRRRGGTRRDRDRAPGAARRPHPTRAHIETWPWPCRPTR